MGVLAQGRSFFVSGSERLRLLCWHPQRQWRDIDLGTWRETDASELRLWAESQWLCLWSEKWLSVVDIRKATPRTLLRQPIAIPEGVRIIAIALGQIWAEKDKQLECLDPQALMRGWQPLSTFPLQASLQSFRVDRYLEAAFVANGNHILLADEEGKIWKWHRGEKNLTLLPYNGRISLLPVAVCWRGWSEIVFVDSEHWLCYDIKSSSWRKVTLTVRVSGSHAVVMGERMWLPIAGGQRWVLCDEQGIVLTECNLPQQTNSLYAFATGKCLWTLQRDGNLVRLFCCDLNGTLREQGVWEFRDQPLAFGQGYNFDGDYFVLLRRSGKAWARHFTGLEQSQ